jgi:hypothetical protein
MTTISTSPSTRQLRGAGREPGALPRRRRACPPRGDDRRALGRYTDRDGRAREVVARAGAAGSTLVIDRDRLTRADARLVAHIAADEPAGNAALVCRSYLRDAAAGVARCRLLNAQDARVIPFAEQPEDEIDVPTLSRDPRLRDGQGCLYALELLPGAMSIPELRWCRCPPRCAAGRTPVSMREVIACLESYEPARALTLRALALHGRDSAVSTCVLRAELARVQTSPIVLNRRLREVVLQAVARGELSMSEIAIRCGRVKRDRRGNEAGETSWLARRLGLLPEGGQRRSTPWIHSDVLALIAREGLGVSPREVEV